jgi:hypothetical protein
MTIAHVLAPTSTQMRVMRKLDAGAELLMANREASTHALTMNGAVLQVLRIDTVHAMALSGWIALNAAKDRYELTRAGKDLVDVRVYVRGLAALQEAS